MSLLLLGASSDPNVRSLFSNNEQGLAIDIGDRNGASEAKRTWRRNLLTYSEQFDNAAWPKTGTTVTANTVANPLDGATTADSLFEVAAASTPRIAFPTMATGVQYTWSVYAKDNGRDQIRIVVDGDASKSTYFTLTGSGTASPGVNATATITSVGNGWYRCTHTATPIISSSPYIATATGGSMIASGDNTKGVYLFGGQYEIGSLSTYQPITDFNTEFKAAFPSHSLYVDSNGVAPAVYPGDQLGLVIDSSRGGLENLGAELVTNGGFDSDTWWSKGTGVTITGGVAQYTAATLNNGVFRTSFLTAGKFYVVTFTVSGFSSGGVRVYTGGNRTSTYAANGTYKVFCLAGSSDASIILEATSAGTTLALDNISVKEIPGIHPYQTTSGSRPALCRTPDGGRRNLLTYTEQFDVTTSGWTKVNVGITANGDTAPDGTLTADKFTETAVTNQFFANGANVGSTSGAGEARTISCYFKAAERSWVRLSIGGSAFPSSNVWFNIGSGAVGTQAGGAGTIQDVGGGWYRCSMTATSSGAGTVLPYVFLSSADNTFSYTGVLGNGAWVWGAQLETGSSATAYQKVGLTSDVTESGKRDCWGLLADGSDDSLITTSVDFSSTDKMTVMAGLRKLSDAALGVVCELSVNQENNNGTFSLFTPDSTATSGQNGFYAKGTSLRSARTVIAAPNTSVYTGAASISDDSTVLRRNGNVAESTALDLGTGNYGNYSLYIGSRAGTSFRFNGILYTLIVRGAATPTGTIADFEKNLLRIRAGLGPF